jgi:vacuolar-type H+-ATPase subunit C/Vma6
VEGALREVVRGSRVRLSEVGEAGALESLEGFLMHVLFFEARSAFGKFPFSISSVAGYMILLRIESRNIRMLLQAKAYGLSSGETAPLLVI